MAFCHWVVSIWCSLTSVNGRQQRVLAWYTDGSKTNKGSGAGVYRQGWRMGHSFSLGLHTMIFQAEYVIKACIMENIEMATQVRTFVFFLTVWQPSRPWWNRQNIRGSSGMGAQTRGNWWKWNNWWIWQVSSYPLIGPEPVFGLSAKVATGVIRKWTSRKHEHWQSVCGQRQDFLFF